MRLQQDFLPKIEEAYKVTQQESESRTVTESDDSSVAGDKASGLAPMFNFSTYSQNAYDMSTQVSPVIQCKIQPEIINL